MPSTRVWRICGVYGSELEAVVETAHRASRPAAAHANGHGIETAVDADNIYIIKLVKTGGIQKAKRLNAAAEAAHRYPQFGANVDGNVGTNAGIHFVTAHATVQWNELVDPFVTPKYINDLTTDNPEIAIGGPDLASHSTTSKPNTWSSDSTTST